MALVFILVKWIFEITLKLIYPLPLIYFHFNLYVGFRKCFPFLIPTELIVRAGKSVPGVVVVLVSLEKPRAE